MKMPPNDSPCQDAPDDSIVTQAETEASFRQQRELHARVTELEAENRALRATLSRVQDSRDPFGDLARVAHEKMELDRLVADRTAALRDSEARLLAIVETAADGIVVVDDAGVIEITNPAAARMFGYATGEMMGRNVAELMPDGFPVAPGPALDHAAPGEPRSAIGRFEARGRRKDGAIFPIDLVCSEFTFRNPRRRVAIICDVTERQLVLEKLRKSEALFRGIVAACSDVVYRMGPDGNEMRVLLGRDSIVDTAEPDRTWLSKYILPEDQPRVVAAITEAIKQKRLFEMEHRVRRADGSVGWTWSRAIPLFDASGEITEWIGVAHDITERREHEIRVAAAAEEERRRIARDLHDGLGQQLGAVLFAAELLGRDLAGRPEALRAIKVRQLARKALEAMREVARALYPVPSALDGLTMALEDLAANVDRKRGVGVFAYTSGVLISDPAVATQLLRIA